MANKDEGPGSLEREGSFGSDDYPEGLPGTTPPDATRYMKTLKLKDKKQGHARKTSPNEAKRLSRELKTIKSLYSPEREVQDFDPGGTVLLEPMDNESGGECSKTTLEKHNEDIRTPTRSGSKGKEKSLKKGYSVPAKIFQQKEDDDLDTSGVIYRSGTISGSSNISPSPVHPGKRRLKVKDKKTAKQREYQREVKRGSLDNEEGISSHQVACDILDTLSPMSERKKKLERSESFDENTKKGYSTEEHESGDELLYSLQPESIYNQGKKRVHFPPKSSTIDPDETSGTAANGQQRRKKSGHFRSRTGKGIPKERREFYDRMKWAIVKFGIGSAKHRPSLPPPPQFGRHFSEGSSGSRRLMREIWTQVNRYLQGYSADIYDQRRFSDFLLQQRFGVNNILRAITNFHLPLDPMAEQENVFEPRSPEGYQEIPGNGDPTPEQSLDLASMSTLQGDPEYRSEYEFVDRQVEDSKDDPPGDRPPGDPPPGDQPPGDLPPGDPPPEDWPKDAVQSSAPTKVDGDLSLNSSSKDYPTKEDYLTSSQLLALTKVSRVLDQLEEALSLYTSSAMLGEDHSEYQRPTFRRKLEALLLWSKVTNGLAQRLADLSKWFGVKILPPMAEDYSLRMEPKVVLQRVFSTESLAPSPSVTLTPITSEHRPICVSPQSVVRVGPYHTFVVRGLKKGIKRMMENISKFIQPTLRIALFVFGNQDTRKDIADNIEEYTPIHPGRHSSSEFPTVCDSYGPVHWISEFEEMNLPMFFEQFLLLARVPLDVMHECLRLQQYLRPPKAPSEFSISRLVTECRETIEWALKVHEDFVAQIHCGQGENMLLFGILNTECEPFQKELANVFSLYLEYITEWIKLSDPCQALTREWPIVKNFCKKMYQHEAKAVKTICVMAADMLWKLEEKIGQEVDTYLDKLLEMDTDLITHRKHLSEATRDFKNWLLKVKEKSSKFLGIARTILKDLEIAGDLHIETSRKELFRHLQATDHVEVVIAGKMDRGKMIFAPRSLVAFSEGEGREIVDLLTLSCGRDDRHPYYSRHRDQMYILILNLDPDECHQEVWRGETTTIDLSIEAAITTMKLEVEDIKLVTWNSSCLDRCWRTVSKALGKAVTLRKLHTSNHQEIALQMEDIRDKAIELSATILSLYDRVQEPWTTVWSSLGDNDPTDTLGYRMMITACFNLGFENVREVIRLLGEDLAYSILGLSFKNHSIQWVQFITEWYKNKGPGRWASAGLDFLMVGCHPKVLAQLSSEEYQEVKDYVNKCLSLVAGEKPRKSSAKRSAMGYPPAFNSPLRNRRNKPLELTHGMPIKSLTEGRKEMQWTKREVLDGGVLPLLSDNVLGNVPTPEDYDEMYPPLPGTLEKTPSSTDSSTSSGVVKDEDSPPTTYDTTPLVVNLAHPTSLEHLFSYTSTDSSTSSTHPPVETPDDMLKITEIRQATLKCDQKRDCKLYEDRIIGRERPDYHPACRNLDTLKQVGFTWIRGIMIGKGSSGRVYQCLNAKTGETMAVKQIPMELNNTPKAIRRLIDEIGSLQRLKHPNIIQYFGVEIHRSELFLFMEYCPEGDIWTLAKQGLDEYMVRHYTSEALQGLSYIHNLGIVHRDIKGANLFIAANGRLKLGDFGLSFQLNNISHTRRGEICEDVGTVAYMAPEVIQGGKQHRIGRGSDIWSLGCTVIEMITGKSPWNELDNEYRIMFAVGNGRAPTIPESVTEEGKDFLECCFKLDPEERWTANVLLDHPFIKVEPTLNGLYS